MEYSLGIDLGTTYSAAATARDDRVEIFQLGERVGDDPVDRGPARRRRGPDRRRRRAPVARRADPDRARVQAPPRRPHADHPRRHAVRRRSAARPPAARHRGARSREQLGGPPAAIVVCHPASYGAYKIDLLHQAIRQADIGNVDAADRARGRRRPLRAPGAGPGRARSSPSTTSAAARSTRRSCARPRPASSSSAGPRAWSASAASTSTRRSSRASMAMVRASGRDGRPDDPATLAAIARLRDECRRAKEALSSDTDATIPVCLPGLQTGDAPDPRGIRGDDPAADPRDDRGAGAGGPERRARVRGRRSRSCSSGGTSRIPLVAEMVREATGRPIAVDAHPKHSMALGAAYIAEQARLAGTDAGRRDRGGGGGCRRRAGSRGASCRRGAAVPVAASEPPPAPLPSAARAAVGAAADSRSAPSPTAAGHGAADATPADRPVRRATGGGSATVAGGSVPMAAVARRRSRWSPCIAVGASGLLGGSAVASPSPSAASVGRLVASPSADARRRRPRRRRSPTPAPTAQPDADRRPRPDAAPTPAGRQAGSPGITVSGNAYVVDFEVFGYTPALPGPPRPLLLRHRRADGGRASRRNRRTWVLYAGPVPFTRLQGRRPAGRRRPDVHPRGQPDHSVVAGDRQLRGPARLARRVSDG